MDLTEALRGEDISRTDFFDFVVAPDVGDQSVLHFNRALKSMGIFVEEAPSPAGAGMSPGGGGGPLPKETNNNHVDGGWSAAASERDAVRLETAILEDLNRFCWGDGGAASCGGGSAGSTGSASPAHRAPGDTDGAIYTLTVLNGGEHACAWYRAPEGPPAPTAAAPRTETRSDDPPPPPPPAFPAPPPVDIDSLLSSVPTAHSPHPPPPPCPTEPTAPLPPMPFPQRNGYAAGPSPPAPPRAASPSAPGGESLLRSALQGRPFAPPPPPPPPPPRFVPPDETPPFPGDPVDDLLLSQLDAASFPEDYEKLKRIAHEVAESVSQFCLEMTPPRGGTYEEVPPAAAAAAAAAEAAAAAAAVATGAARAKKSGGGAKRSGGAARAPGSAPGNGARKERSLHYCSICSKGFKDKYSVNVHIRTHTGEKPFACSLCGKSFRQKAHLAKHYQTHLASHKGSGGGGAGAPAGAGVGGGGASPSPRRPPPPHRAS